MGEDSPEVRNKISPEHLKEPKFSDRVEQSSGPNENSNVRNDDLHSLFRREDHRVGVKI